MADTKRVRLDELKTIPTAVFSNPIFFSKYNVTVGTRLRHYGRRAHGTTWVVNDITTITPGKYGRVQHQIAFVRTLEDILNCRCEETGEWRQLRFVYVSYSAIWRLDL